jgi:plasmid stabilization system protein ParE
MQMELKWTSKSLSDLARLHEFLVPVNKLAATKVVQALAKAPNILLSNPRIGKPLPQFAPREVRRILSSEYEIRYEILGSVIHILRLWHTKEDR